MALPRLKSPDGKVTRVVTSQAELELYTEKYGYTRVRTAAQKAADEQRSADAAAEKAAAEKAAAEKAAASKTPPKS